ncbi:acyl-CoA carboxylase subunit epsilon [Streptomyces sp. CAU 1734]|uniref:acyl-CoA carboxylase subunit epsilon n=1 Tax=Streptomyces sp. CAU 1734 TaxID=3140360 RepID=UPI003261CC28
MAEDIDNGTVIRLEHGRAGEEELAAVAVTVLSLIARQERERRETGSGERSVAGWRRQERNPGYQAPHSWR